MSKSIEKLWRSLTNDEYEKRRNNLFSSIDRLVNQFENDIYKANNLTCNRDSEEYKQFINVRRCSLQEKALSSIRNYWLNTENQAVVKSFKRVANVDDIKKLKSAFKKLSECLEEARPELLYSLYRDSDIPLPDKESFEKWIDTLTIYRDSRNSDNRKRVEPKADQLIVDRLVEAAIDETGFPAKEQDSHAYSKQLLEFIKYYIESCAYFGTIDLPQWQTINGDIDKLQQMTHQAISNLIQN